MDWIGYVNKGIKGWELNRLDTASFHFLEARDQAAEDLLLQNDPHTSTVHYSTVRYEYSPVHIQQEKTNKRRGVRCVVFKSVSRARARVARGRVRVVRQENEQTNERASRYSDGSDSSAREWPRVRSRVGARVGADGHRVLCGAVRCALGPARCSLSLRLTQPTQLTPTARTAHGHGRSTLLYCTVLYCTLVAVARAARASFSRGEEGTRECPGGPRSRLSAHPKGEPSPPPPH